LEESKKRYQANIQTRENGMPALRSAEESKKFSYETADEDTKAAALAAWDAAQAQISSAEQENEDDQRLVDAFEYNIRQVKNDLRINKAQLVAERTNAELMVAIKQEMNWADDIDMYDARASELRADKDADPAPTEARLEAIEAELGVITTDKKEA
jgi:hypothetical protein